MSDQPLSVYEYLIILNQYIDDVLRIEEIENPVKLRRYMQVSKLLFVAEKLLEKGLIDNDERADDKR